MPAVCRAAPFVRRCVPDDATDDFAAHDGAVRCVALGQKTGQVVATGGDDCKMHLWRVGQPASWGSLSGLKRPCRSLAFDNAEQAILVGTESGVLKQFELSSLKVLRSLKGHKSGITALAWHPYDGNLCVSGGADTVVKVWDVRQKEEFVTLKGHTSAVTTLCVSPDGRFVASGSDEGVVKVWDLTAGTGRESLSYASHRAAITSVAFHPLEWMLASASVDRSVQVWDLKKCATIGVIPHEIRTMQGVKFSPDGASRQRMTVSMQVAVLC